MTALGSMQSPRLRQGDEEPDADTDSRTSATNASWFSSFVQQALEDRDALIKRCRSIGPAITADDKCSTEETDCTEYDICSLAHPLIPIRPSLPRSLRRLQVVPDSSSADRAASPPMLSPSTASRPPGVFPSSAVFISSVREIDVCASSASLRAMSPRSGYQRAHRPRTAPSTWRSCAPSIPSSIRHSAPLTMTARAMERSRRPVRGEKEKEK